MGFTESLQLAQGVERSGPASNDANDNHSHSHVNSVFLRMREKSTRRVLVGNGEFFDPAGFEQIAMQQAGGAFEFEVLDADEAVVIDLE